MFPAFPAHAQSAILRIVERPMGHASLGVVGVWHVLQLFLHLHWHWYNYLILLKYPWSIWVNSFHETTMNWPYKHHKNTTNRTCNSFDVLSCFKYMYSMHKVHYGLQSSTLHLHSFRYFVLQRKVTNLIFVGDIKYLFVGATLSCKIPHSFMDPPQHLVTLDTNFFMRPVCIRKWYTLMAWCKPAASPVR